MASSLGKLVGIDLGTTFSAVATLDQHGQPATLPNVEGELLTPSAVLIQEGAAIVGQAARDVSLEQPDQVALFVKRSMGQPKFPYAVSGIEFRPETLSAIILSKLVQDAERRVGPVKRAVITVPAYFDDTRRKATKDAGRIAGLDVIDILDEPTAAALAYSFQATSQASPSVKASDALPIPAQTVLVYDLGGGTFDVTLVRLSPRRFESLAIEGDVRLGGKDWDDRIVDFVAEKFIAQHGEDPRKDPLSHVNLVAAAERAKRTLSKLLKTSIVCTHAGKVLSLSITRQDFETMTLDLLTRTRLTTQTVLRQAGMTWDKVDRVLLVGGSTHMPMTGQMLQELSGKIPDKSLAVSEVVARGAAIHAGIVAARMGEPMDDEVAGALGDVVEINVNSHSLGIEVKVGADRNNDILIPKNTQLPTSAVRTYRTAAENQQRVRVKVLQGEGKQSEACIQIGECWVQGLPANLPKGAPIQVKCGVASNGMIEVTAIDQTSGKSARTEIHRQSGLSEEELKREADWLGSIAIQ